MRAAAALARSRFLSGVGLVALSALAAALAAGGPLPRWLLAPGLVFALPGARASAARGLRLLLL